MIKISDAREAYSVLFNSMSRNTIKDHKIAALLMFLIQNNLELDNIEIYNDSEFESYAGNIDEGGSDHGSLNLIPDELTVYDFDLSGYGGGFIFNDLYVSLEYLSPDKELVDNRTVYCIQEGHWRMMHADPAEYVRYATMACIPDIEIQQCSCAWELVELCKKYKRIEEESK